MPRWKHVPAAGESPPALFVGGSFTSAGGSTRHRMAKVVAGSWGTVGNSPTHIGNGDALCFSNGWQGQLVVTGAYTIWDGVTTYYNNPRVWDGTAWTLLGGGLSGGLYSPFHVSAGVGGELWMTGTGSYPEWFAAWNGTSWVDPGGIGLNGRPRDILVDEDAGDVWLTGTFNQSGDGTVCERIARWDGTSFSPLGVGLQSDGTSLAMFDGDLHVSGYLYATKDWATTLKYVARWDGSAWHDLAGGADATVMAIATFDDGSGEALYATGNFRSIGGIPASRIARWDGTSWSALGSGLNRNGHALEVHDDGTGPALYVGGEFTSAGGVAANRIAKWDGTSWSAVGVGCNGTVKTLYSGPDL